MIIADHVVKLVVGVVCVIPSGVVHRVISTSEDFSGVHIISVDCSVLHSSGTKAMTGILANNKKFHLQFLKLMRNYDRKDESKKTMLYRSIVKFFKRCDVLFSNKPDKRSAASVHWSAAKIKELIDSGSGIRDCFRYIEEHVPFSKEHCNRLFKKYYGLTIQGYALNARTEKARRLLKNGVSLSKSAMEAGFYDQSQLTKSFRSIFQLTPAQYRKQVR